MSLDQRIYVIRRTDSNPHRLTKRQLTQPLPALLCRQLYWRTGSSEYSRQSEERLGELTFCRTIGGCCLFYTSDIQYNHWLRPLVDAFGHTKDCWVVSHFFYSQNKTKYNLSSREVKTVPIFRDHCIFILSQQSHWLQFSGNPTDFALTNTAIKSHQNCSDVIKFVFVSFKRECMTK